VGRGWLDEVALYDSALTDQAVARHHEAGAAPGAPTGLLAVAGNGDVKLDWNDNPEQDLAGYDVYRSTSAGGPYTKLNSSHLNSAPYTDASATNDTRYYYVVRALDTAGNESSTASEVSAKPYSSPYRDAVTSTPGLISYWRLGEGSGSRAADQQLANHGAYQGALELGAQGALAGDPDTAARFDGVDDRVEVPHSGSLDPDSIAVEVWARSDGATWNQHGWFASKGDTFVLHPREGSRTVSWYVQKAGGDGWRRIDYTPADITVWHHYVGTYDAATGELALYVDGETVSSTNLGPGGLRPSQDALTIGSDSGNLRNRVGRGWLDEVALYDSALADGVVAEHYELGAAPP
jgi:hypothetical protein